MGKGAALLALCLARDAGRAAGRASAKGTLGSNSHASSLGEAAAGALQLKLARTSPHPTFTLLHLHPRQEEALDFIYWFRQVLGIVAGIVWGYIPLPGLVGFVG